MSGHSLRAATIVVVAALVATGCGKFGSTYKASSTTGTTRDEKVTSAPFDAAAQKAAGCDQIKAYPSAGREHLPNFTEHVAHSTNPPTSGPHYNVNQANPTVPMPYGIYTTTAADEVWIHNLEHGQIVIVYKGLSKSDLSTLVSQVKKDPQLLSVMPRPKNPKNGVYYVAWQNMLYCQHPSAPALQTMIDDFRNAGPEPIGMNQQAKS